MPVTAPPVDPATGRAIAELWRLLRGDPTDARLWSDLSGHYATHGLLPQRAYAARQLQRLNAAASAPSPACLEPRPGTPGPQAAEELLRQPRDPAARAWSTALEDWLKICPGDWLSWLYLARLEDGGEPAPGKASPDTAAADGILDATTPGLIQAGARAPGGDAAPSGQDQRTALEAGPDDRNRRPPLALRQAEALEPIQGESRHWLGLWRLNGGDQHGAIAALAPLATLQPLRHGSMLYLGEALLRAGRRPAAEAAFTRASSSSNPAFLRLLAERVHRHNE